MKSFDTSIRGFYKDAARVSRRDPGLAFQFARAGFKQHGAAGRRRQAAKAGVQVPPLMILSLTRRCNLRCAGCFVQAQDRPAGPELTMAEIRTILSDARDLGVSIVALAGGEPLTRPAILDVVAEFPEPIQLLYLDADGDKGRGKGIYLEILEAGLSKMPKGSVVLAHNSVNCAERLKDYLAFVRDPEKMGASVNVILDGEGLRLVGASI
jgi:hypothetical protein